VDLVHHQRVLSGDEVVLEPPACNAGRDDHHIPERSFRRRLALAVHDTNAEGLLQDRLGDRTDAQCLADAGARHDAEALALTGPAPEFLPVLALQHRVEMQPEGQLDRLAGRTRRGNDDDPPVGMGCLTKDFGIEREVVISRGMHWLKKGRTSRISKDSKFN
jgi:hypothetical protein